MILGDKMNLVISLFLNFYSKMASILLEKVVKLREEEQQLVEQIMQKIRGEPFPIENDPISFMPFFKSKSPAFNQFARSSPPPPPHHHLS